MAKGARGEVGGGPNVHQQLRWARTGGEDHLNGTLPLKANDRQNWQIKQKNKKNDLDIATGVKGARERRISGANQANCLVWSGKASTEIFSSIHSGIGRTGAGLDKERVLLNGETQKIDPPEALCAISLYAPCPPSHRISMPRGTSSPPIPLANIECIWGGTPPGRIRLMRSWTDGPLPSFMGRTTHSFSHSFARSFVCLSMHSPHLIRSFIHSAVHF